MIIARIESDLVPCNEFTSVHLRAQWENGPVFAQASDSTAARDVCDAGLHVPGEIGVVPRDPADPRRVILRVTGTARAPDGATYTLRQEFVTRFQRGQVVYVAFSLARVCASNPCPSGYSCVPGPRGEARCASREEPVVFTQGEATRRDATVWGDAASVDLPIGDINVDDSTGDLPEHDSASEELVTPVDSPTGCVPHPAHATLLISC